MKRQERRLTEREVITEALDLSVDETKSTSCPFCRASHEQSFSITRTEQGLLYNCYRAACSAKGFISSLPGTTQLGRGDKKKTFTPKEFTHSLVPLPEEVVKDLYNKYELTEEELNEQGFRYVPDQDRIYMPIFDRNGQEYGGNTKIYGPRATGPKTVVYRTRETSGLHYVRKGGQKEKCICVVEDILSALKISRYVRGVALLGHNLTGQMVEELREETDTLILMLDPDVIHKALNYKKKYSFYFKELKVVLLDADPKDTKHIELRELFTNLAVL